MVTAKEARELNEVVPCLKDGCKGYLLMCTSRTPIYENETYIIANTHRGERQVIKGYDHGICWKCSLCERVI